MASVLSAGLDVLLCRRGLRRGIAERDALLLIREATILERERTTRERELRIEQLEAECDALRERIEAREETTRLRELRIEQLEAECDTLRERIEEREDTTRLRELRIEQVEAECDTLRRHIQDQHGASTPEAPLPMQDREQTGAAFLEPGRTSWRSRSSPAMTTSTPSAQGDAPAAFDPDEARRDAHVRDWRAFVAEEGHVQAGSQVFIEPYIVQRRMAGIPTSILIGTREGQRWYDTLDLTDCPWVQMLGMVGPGDTVLDCGSNQGINALHYSAIVGREGRVHGFDPFPINTRLAQLNASLNGRDNMSFHRQAIGKEAGRLSVSVAAQTIHHSQGARGAIEVEIISLDSLAPLRPNFLKLDIEGAEVDALEGATRILALMPSVFLELHPAEIARFGRAPAEIFSYLPLDRYTCLINYPNLPSLTRYKGEFELSLPCGMFFVPKNKPPIRRFFPRAA